MSVSSALTLALSAITAADKGLTTGPQETFFQSVFKRHTNYAISTTTQSLANGGSGAALIGSAGSSPSRVSTTLQRTSDLIGQIWVRTVLPALNTITLFGGTGHVDLLDASITAIHTGGDPISTSEALTAVGEGFAYVNDVGHYMVREAETQIGGFLMDDYIAEQAHLEWMSENAVDRLCRKSLGIGTDQERISSAFQEQVIYSPLHFWFGCHPSKFLPHVAMQAHDHLLNLTGRAADTLWGGIGDTASATAVTQKAGVDAAIANAQQELVIEVVYLDKAERQAMVSNALEYQITEHQRVSTTVQTAAVNMNAISFNLPCCDLIIAARRNSLTRAGAQPSVVGLLPDTVHPFRSNAFHHTPEAWTDFSAGASIATGVRQPFIEQVQVRLNNYELLPTMTKQGHFYSEVMPAQRKMQGSANDTFAAYINFGLDSTKTNMDGTVNMSAIDHLSVQLTLASHPAQSYFGASTTAAALTGDAAAHYDPLAAPDATVWVFARNYNVIRILSGMVGKVFAS